MTSAGGRTVVAVGGEEHEVDQEAVEAAGAVLLGGPGEGREPTAGRLEPRSWFDNVRRSPAEELDAGPSTERLVADLRIDRLLDDVADGLQAVPAATPLAPSLPPAEERRGLARALRNATADVHVAPTDSRLRGVDARGRLQIPASRRTQAGGVTGGGISLTLRLFELDSEQRIPVPPRSRPFPESLRYGERLLEQGALAIPRRHSASAGR